MPAPVIDVCSRFEDVAGEWDSLADQTGAAPWMRPAWHAAWWQAFGRGRLEILAARHGDRLVGVLPLERWRDELRSTSNYHTPSFTVLAEEPSSRRALARAALARGAPRLALRFLPADDPSSATVSDAARETRRKILVRVLERSPIVDCRVDWGEFERRRRGHLLRELRRRRRRLAGHGRVTVSVEDGRSRLPDLLDEGFVVERAGWKGQRGTAMASQPRTRAFYRKIAAWAAEHGWLRLGFLRVDGRPVAFDFAMECRGIHYLLKTGYDPTFRAYSPGMLLRQEMLRRAFDCGLERYEFLGHDDPWKREWSDATSDQLLVQAFDRSPLGLAEWAAFAYGRPLAKRLLARR